MDTNLRGRVSKSSILMLSKALAKEFGPHGVRSNCVSPGPTRTPAWDRPGGFTESLAERFGLSPDAAVDHFAKDVKQIPLGRLGQPGEIAQAVVFLACDLATYVSGATIGSTAARFSRLDGWRRQTRHRSRGEGQGESQS